MKQLIEHNETTDKLLALNNDFEITVALSYLRDEVVSRNLDAETAFTFGVITQQFRWIKALRSSILIGETPHDDEVETYNRYITLIESVDGLGEAMLDGVEVWKCKLQKENPEEWCRLYLHTMIKKG